ncbi:MAG: type II toxin-antitoxin system RelE/ParE family toxin [Neisseriaceae bacterium]|nr:type II toxin-antitoxin system RelE/ParE family toxin [Neisseriaceae bacterium]
MRIFKNQWINKYAHKQHIADEDLISAVCRAEQGLIDADLGGGVIKQRIARKGQGKSGGYRSIVLLKKGDKAFFVYAFGKNERDNISEEELAELKLSAKIMLNWTDEQIEAQIKNKTLWELKQ